jgi:hypothetical protein
MDIYTTRLYLLILQCNLRFYQKILLAVSSSLLLTVCLRDWVTKDSSKISNQLEAGLIMVRYIKSICELFLPLRVCGPMSLTDKHSQGLLMTVLGGRCL